MLLTIPVTKSRGGLEQYEKRKISSVTSYITGLEYAIWSLLVSTAELACMLWSSQLACRSGQKRFFRKFHGDLWITIKHA